MSTAVITRSYDNQRTGSYPHETVLTPAAILARGLTSYYPLPFEGDARGTEAPTLVLPGVKCDDGLVHDLAFCVTMANDVYGFDANTGGLLWERRIANPIKGTRKMDMYLINDWWGILSTPVIDPNTKIGYCVAMTSPDATFANSSHWLHAINLVDGSEAHPPVNLSLATYQPPNGLPLMRMGAVARKQRCGLLLDERDGRKMVYVANGSFIESAVTNQGWVIAVDVTAAPKLGAAWTSTSRYSGGGIWMGSQGPSLDPKTGDIFLTVGNGSFDAITDFGESAVRLRYTPAANGAPASIRVIDHATPFTDPGRVADQKYQTLASISLLPKDYQDDDDGAATNMDSAGDEDLNSGGPLIILASESGLSKDLVFFAGKDGIGYLVDMANMGGQKLADFDPATIQKNVYAKFLVITGFTYYPAGVNLTPTDLSTIPTQYGTPPLTHHLHSTPVFFRSKLHGPMLFGWGENGNLRAFSITENNGRFSLNYLACGAEVASPWTPSPGGMPGGMISLSYNAAVPTNTAIVWACVPMGNANSQITQGRLIAYDAETFASYPDGSKQISVLWDSLRYPNIKFSHSKFTIPHVFGGKVFCPTYDGHTAVFQLT